MRDSAQANRAREDFNRSVQALGAAAAASPFPDLLEETRAFSTPTLGSLQAQPAAAVLARFPAQRESLRDARLPYAETCEGPLDDATLADMAPLLSGPGAVNPSHTPQ